MHWRWKFRKKGFVSNNKKKVAYGFWFLCSLFLWTHYHAQSLPCVSHIFPHLIHTSLISSPYFSHRTTSPVVFFFSFHLMNCLVCIKEKKKSQSTSTVREQQCCFCVKTIRTDMDLTLSVWGLLAGVHVCLCRSRGTNGPLPPDCPLPLMPSVNRVSGGQDPLSARLTAEWVSILATSRSAESQITCILAFPRVFCLGGF